ncbi:hypothetical protein KSZ_66710 [Dictyobacter formicarum]|uniref:Uncharacterized protein n=1 Tax=Dictyobacter formicarum TaxID=2778368 RepID=A0ABQ3VS76_9CHLR|nr:hypothetical protein KSZ_66710 [Dictyobacter formicarum]
MGEALLGQRLFIDQDNAALSGPWQRLDGNSQRLLRPLAIYAAEADIDRRESHLGTVSLIEDKSGERNNTFYLRDKRHNA